MSDPDVRHWRQHKTGRHVPFLGYYRRSYATSLDGTVTEHGAGFMLTSIDPYDPIDTKDIVIRAVAFDHDFRILVGGDDKTMSRPFAIGWSKKFTFEPLSDP